MCQQQLDFYERYRLISPPSLLPFVYRRLYHRLPTPSPHQSQSRPLAQEAPLQPSVYQAMMINHEITQTSRSVERDSFGLPWSNVIIRNVCVFASRSYRDLQFEQAAPKDPLSHHHLPSNHQACHHKRSALCYAPLPSPNAIITSPHP